MKKIAYFIPLFLLLLLGSCSRQTDITPEMLESDGAITLTTEAPDWDTDTRAVINEAPGSLSLIATFKAEDKVRLFMVQDATLYDLGDVAFAEVSADGQVAKLSITVPEGVDTSKPVDLIGYNGLNQKYITVADGKAIVSVSAFNHTAIEQFRAPVFFRLKGIMPTAEALTARNVKFQHLGAYEIVHFTNKSTDTIKGRVTLSEVNGYGPKKSWAYMDGYKSGVGSVYYSYDIITGVVTEGKDRIRSDYYVLPDIATGETKSVISWVLPRPDVKIPTTVLDFYSSTGTTHNFQSKGMIAAKSFGMEVGKAYHTYGYWDGSKVVALEPDTQKERPTAFVSFTTNKATGKTLKFKTYVPYASSTTAWVDYNDNGIKDDITESAPANFSEKQISIKNPKITFHGGFEAIEIPEQGITKAEISPVSSVTQIDISKNEMTKEALDAFFEQLPDISGIQASILQPKTLKVSGNPGAETCNAKIAIRKGWILDVTIIDETQPYIQVSLGSYGSKDIYFYIDAATADHNGVWVDLNGDGEKGAGESITKFGATTLNKITAISQDVVFYGNVNKLDFISANIFAYYGGTNSALKYLNLANAGTVAVITQGHPNLEFLNVSGNQLYTDIVELHVATLTKLKVLDMGNCMAGDMDFSKNTELKYLNVEGNKMTQLDISALPNLTQLICSSNSIKTLDISKATGLFHLEAVQNSLSAEQVNKLINALPNRAGKSAGGLWIANNPGTGAGDFHLAKGKNWTIDARNSKADNKVRRPIMEGEDW